VNAFAVAPDLLVVCWWCLDEEAVFVAAPMSMEDASQVSAAHYCWAHPRAAELQPEIRLAYGYLWNGNLLNERDYLEGCVTAGLVKNGA
jgi:hypothetical protein